MGSEGPAVVTVHLTGFKRFQGVAENPTEAIVRNLTAFMQKRGTPEGLYLGSCNVLDTVGEGALSVLYQIFELAAADIKSESSSGRKVILLHLGVNSEATKFALERQSVNEATFRCPDEMGWKPQKAAIVPSDGSISRRRQTSLPVEDIKKALAELGYEVTVSDDAGRFVCNYVYYHSLRFAEENGIQSLFVHVPPFLVIEEDTQMKIVGSILEFLATLN